MSQLVGMVTDRDLHLIEAPLDEVASETAAHKYGSAVVMQNGKVVGIFTAVDACRALAELLQTRLSK